MIDTTTLKYSRSDYLTLEQYNKEYNILKSNLNLLDDVIHKINVRNGAEEQFELKKYDLLLQKFENHFILSISLWKFYKGNNLLPFEFTEIPKALKMLSSFLGFRFEKGLLQRIDIAQNFEMDNPCSAYIRHIQKPAGMEWLYEYGSKAVAFSNRSRNQQIVLYDKGAKTSRDGAASPESPENLLRYEYRIKKQLRQTINWGGSKARIKGAYLYSTKFLSYLLKKWFQGFCKIDLPNVPTGTALVDSSQYKRYLASMGIIANGGLANCYKDIETIINDDGKPMSASSKSKLRKDLRELMKDRQVTQPSPLIRELRSKVVSRFRELKTQQKSKIFSTG